MPDRAAEWLEAKRRYQALKARASLYTNWGLVQLWMQVHTFTLFTNGRQRVVMAGNQFIHTTNNATPMELMESMLYWDEYGYFQRGPFGLYRTDPFVSPQRVW